MPEPSDPFNAWNNQQTDQQRMDAITVRFGHSGHEYPQTFLEWRTRAQLVLEHHYRIARDFAHNYSLNCFTPEHTAHPICTINARISTLLKVVSTQGAKYELPSYNRLEMGDEKSPTTPLTPEERAQFDMLVTSTTDFEMELAKFRSAGAVPQISAITTPAAVTRTPTTASQAPRAALQSGSVQELAGGIQRSGVVVRQPESQRSIESRVELINPLEDARGFTLQFTRLFNELNMPAWADALAGVEQKIAALSADKREFIEREMQDGAHAFLMPGKRIIKETLGAAIQNMKPVWYENGQEKTLVATYQWGHISSMITNKNDALFVDMPDDPYLFLALPTPRAEPDTFNKKLTDQKALLREWQKAYPEYIAMNIPGYLVFQALETRAALTTAQTRGAQNFTVRPLDYYDGTDNTSFTRFLDLPVSVGDVPFGYFFPGNRQLGLNGDDAGDAYPKRGFRLERRVNL